MPTLEHVQEYLQQQQLGAASLVGLVWDSAKEFALLSFP